MLKTGWCITELEDNTDREKCKKMFAKDTADN